MKDIILALIGNDKALVALIIGELVTAGTLKTADPTNIIGTGIAALAAFVTGIAVGRSGTDGKGV